jgi:hypothetical protein
VRYETISRLAAVVAERVAGHSRYVAFVGDVAGGAPGYDVALQCHVKEVGEIGAALGAV